MNYFCIIKTWKVDKGVRGHNVPYSCHRSQCQVCIDYQAGKVKPAYPVPTTIRYDLELEALCDGWLPKRKTWWLIIG